MVTNIIFYFCQHVPLNPTHWTYKSINGSSFEMRLRCNKGSKFAQRALFFYFQGTLAGAKCNKHTRASYSWLLFKKKREKKTTKKKKNTTKQIHLELKEVSRSGSTRDIISSFFFWHSYVVKKKLPIYTTEHCNNVVTLTKILGSWLSLCAWTCICTVILIRYCVVISFLFFISRGVQYGLWGTFSVTGKWGKQML